MLELPVSFAGTVIYLLQKKVLLIILRILFFTNKDNQ